jgi:coenzyme F420 hydrogenase subunit beta
MSIKTDKTDNSKGIMDVTEIQGTISEVVKSNLCSGCGTCSALCPKEAISLKIDKDKGVYVAQIDDQKCIQCHICFEVCPGHGTDYNSLNKEIFGKSPENILIGNYQNCYSGNSTNYDIRYNSSSGGLVTQTLIFALEEGIIDGAIVTRMNKENPLEPEPFIARTKEEIIEASGSKYCPVPLNIVLENVLKTEGKFAIVGLPCHIDGLRKAEQVNKKLRQKIVLRLGIFCNHSPNFYATKTLLRKLNIKENDVNKINYRGEGYPGKLNILSGKNKMNLVQLTSWRLIGSHFFYPNRCLCCSNGVCELADISFGDAWLPEMSEEKIGISILISKTEFGDKLLRKMESKNSIRLNQLDVRKVVQSQEGMLYVKKKKTKAYRYLFGTAPDNNNLLKSDRLDFMLSLFPCLTVRLFSSPVFRKILPNVPTKVIWLYSVPYFYFILKRAKSNFKRNKWTS